MSVYSLMATGIVVLGLILFFQHLEANHAEEKRWLRL